MEGGGWEGGDRQAGCDISRGRRFFWLGVWGGPLQPHIPAANVFFLKLTMLYSIKLGLEGSAVEVEKLGLRRGTHDACKI